jgi:hypothetical protein
MIIYNQAFDLYHCIFRVLNLLSKFDETANIEVDRLRIWDFYLLFPQKIYDIRLPQSEAYDIRKIRNRFIKKSKNPYEHVPESRKLFEKLRPYQNSALSSIASYGIISKENLALNRITITDKNLLSRYVENLEKISPKQKNTIALLTSHFYQMSLFGSDGLKNRTNLLECKYDA